MTVFELLYFCLLRFEFQHKIQNSTDVMVSGVLQQKLLCCVLKFILTLDYVILICHLHLIVVCRRFSPIALRLSLPFRVLIFQRIQN